MKEVICPTCGERSTKRFFIKRALAKAERGKESAEREMQLARAERDQLERIYQQLRMQFKAK